MKIFLYLLILFISTVSPATTVQKFVTVPIQNANESYSVNTLFITDSKYIRPPLVVISHGSPLDPSYRRRMVPQQLLPQAMKFVELGFAALIVERRGYGHSKENFEEIVGDCDHRDNIASGRIASSDILGALDFAEKNLQINNSNVILVGHSAGGFSSIFASGYGFHGVKAVINFAGGRGADGCSRQNVLSAFAFVGKMSRIPTFWIYNENDKAFPPNIAKQMLNSFKSTGGQAELKMLPAFGRDGHSLFSDVAGIPIWLPITKDFLLSVNSCPLCIPNTRF